MTFYVDEEIIDGRNVISFSSLEGKTTPLNVQKYQFAKLFKTAVVLFLENMECIVYRFTIDVNKKAIIFDQHNPLTIPIS